MKRISLVVMLLCASLSQAQAADVQKSLVVVFGHEGGLQCEATDPGNWTSGRVGMGRHGCTKYGIATNTYPMEDIRHLTLQRAALLYKRDFWSPLRLSELKSQGIATEIFDTAVNCGVGTSANIVTQTINRLGRKTYKLDGKLSRGRIAWINEYTRKRANRKTFWKVLNALQAQRYLSIMERNPSMSRYANSWFSRVGG